MKKTFETLGIIAFVAVIGFALATCSNGSTTPPGTTPITYAIGDTGPGGGIVFYDKGEYTDGWRYLEAASDDQGTMAWCNCASYSRCTVTDAVGTAIGTGKANTTAIIVAHPDDDYTNNAAKATQGTIGSKSDWFLPSVEELKEMYKAIGKPGIPTTGFFWSSSEDKTNYTFAIGLGFDDGGSGSMDKDSGSDGVRAVRAF